MLLIAVQQIIPQYFKEMSWLTHHRSKKKEPFGVLLGKMFFTGISGGLVVAMIFISTIYFGVYPNAPKEFDINYYGLMYNMNTSNSDDRVKLLVKEVIEKETERAETRLRDHFTHLITLSGITITIIIAVFSISQIRNEEKFKADIEKIKLESENNLNEIKDLRDKALNYTDTIHIMKRKFEKKANSSASNDFDETQQTDGETVADGISNDECNKNDYDNIQSNKLQKRSDTFEGKCISKVDSCVDKEIINDDMVESMIQKAEAGDCDAQVRLSRYYRCGKDGTSDDEKSRFWIEKAARANHAEGQYIYAIFNEKGIGGIRDTDEALRMYTLSANQNFAPAQYKLGKVYRLGDLGVEKNLDLTVMWLEKAAKNGYADAQFALGVMLAGSQSEYPADEVKGREWYLKAAQQGHCKAQFNLALMFARGKGGNIDMPEAIKWFTRASEQGDPKALYRLALVYHEGKYLPQDENKATSLIKAAADKGHLKALEEMAKRYFVGKGTPENYVKAYAYLLAFKAKAGSNSRTDELLTNFKKVLTPEQIAEAQIEADGLWRGMDSFSHVMRLAA